MTRNRSLLLSLLVLFVQAVTGQELHTEGAAPDLYVTHKVAAKETWFSLGRTFSLTPNELASYNKQNTDKPLEIGTTLRIPLTKSNFSQEDPTGSVDDLVPVYHVVGEKEWMYRISVNHNKVPIEKLERWNNITRDQAKAGKKLIVGFLAPAKGAPTTASTSTAASTPPPAKQPAAQVPVTPPAPTPASTGVTSTPGSKEHGGYFKTQYDENGKNQAAVSGIFKSTSGWNDGKYYALMNNVTVGTIVKVNYPSTNKFVFAKVLGELPDMKESAGLSLRISDAAAKELGAVSNKFSVQVMY